MATSYRDPSKKPTASDKTGGATESNDTEADDDTSELKALQNRLEGLLALRKDLADG